MYPAAAPVEFVGFYLLWELIPAKRRNRFIIVIMDRFSKLARTVPQDRITAQSVEKEFFTKWVLECCPTMVVVLKRSPVHVKVF